jgi:hypothetical protein
VLISINRKGVIVIRLVVRAKRRPRAHTRPGAGPLCPLQVPRERSDSTVELQCRLALQQEKTRLCDGHACLLRKLVI